jgi:hypothetical protein
MIGRFEGKSRLVPCVNGCGHMVFFNNDILWNGKPRPREIVDGIEQWHNCPNWKRNDKTIEEKIKELEERIRVLEQKQT